MSDNKIKGTIYLNFKNKSEEKKKKINDWLQNQENQTNSILSLIEHAIDRFGNSDIMDHSISKKMHTELLYFSEDGNAFPLFTFNKKENNENDLSPKENHHEIVPDKKTIINNDTSSNEIREEEKVVEQVDKFPGLNLDNF